MNPADPSRCRVLELGCAAGGNIIPMALADPHSQFVGIDLSPRQIDDARATARQLNLTNLDLRAADILDLSDDLGSFDYVLCHGVYSWVPPQVQHRILEICSRNLAPQGIAYVSYNCYPGWHTRGAIREMLWYHTEQFADAAVRIRAARGLLALLAKAAPADSGYGILIRQELAVLLATPDTYLLHEHLEEFNEPLYFRQFVDRAAAKRLQYLGEAQITAMAAGKFGPDVEQVLRTISSDLLHMEQYMDFLRNRMFRQTLLCHDAVKLDHTLNSEVVRRFFISSSATPRSPVAGAVSDSAEEFGTPGKATLTTRDPLMKAAMHSLADAAPSALRFDALIAAARARLASDAAGMADDHRQLAARLLNCYFSGLVDFSLSPPACVRDVSDRPLASPYARLRARDGGKVVNLRLESVLLTAPSRLVLQHLDGRHDRRALVEIVAQWLRTAPPKTADPLLVPAESSAAPSPQPPPAQADVPPEVRAAAYVDALLRAFARSALLIA
jgi:methyltransferase-like protein/SAM-dependent methyltransferase